MIRERLTGCSIMLLSCMAIESCAVHRVLTSAKEAIAPFRSAMFALGVAAVGFGLFVAGAAAGSWWN